MTDSTLPPEQEASKKNALERLLQMEGSDFPALSGTISEINRVVASDSSSSARLTKAILQDISLTNKLLKLVNTASYGQFGGKINTISKAVVILGFDTVRNVAMALILLEFMHNKSQAVQLKDDVVASFFSGVLAFKLCGRNVRDAEEAMICAMLHALGRMLATFYFFEESQQIDRLIEQGESEARASFKVLGISYNDLGIGISKHWGFPDRLLAGMQKTQSGKLGKPRTELEHLNVTANLANELCAISANTPLENKQDALKRLAERYQDAVPINADELTEVLQEGLAEVSVRAAIINLPTVNSRFLKTIKQWSGQTQEKSAPVDEQMQGITALDEAAEIDIEEDEAEVEKIDPESILSAGIQDVTNTLVMDYTLNDILQMVLETMFRAMRFNRILVFVGDSKTGSMRARLGFGRDVDRLMPKFHFPLQFEADVFHIVLQKGVDIVIEDVTADNIASKIPAWHRTAVTAKSFLLLPIMINKRAIGMFYADMENKDSLQITPRQLGLLRTLRNQAILAIKQKQ